MTRRKRLDELCVGECATVDSLLCKGSVRRRFLDIGLVRGTKVICKGESPLGDPRAYLIRGALIAVRGTDAHNVEIK